MSAARRRKPAPAQADTAPSTQAPFDQWLDDQLRTMYRSALSEPLPAEFLALIEQASRKKPPRR